MEAHGRNPKRAIVDGRSPYLPNGRLNFSSLDLCNFASPQFLALFDLQNLQTVEDSLENMTQKSTLKSNTKPSSRSETGGYAIFEQPKCKNNSKKSKLDRGSRIWQKAEPRMTQNRLSDSQQCKLSKNRLSGLFGLSTGCWGYRGCPSHERWTWYFLESLTVQGIWVHGLFSCSGQNEGVHRLALPRNSRENPRL
ncbi:hypothetical protein M9H77_03123 [Catharanthus roseus]|uniref:Uncharacterized protein n=1 Tax=Catharanthus roseus TaxID=4058 RepID=A0ACC0CAJ1_CATRO|nr:hypothetical protein M9H77_03123 [Catharanthus roseus]